MNLYKLVEFDNDLQLPDGYYNAMFGSKPIIVEMRDNIPYYEPHSEINLIPELDSFKPNAIARYGKIFIPVT